MKSMQSYTVNKKVGLDKTEQCLPFGRHQFFDAPVPGQVGADSGAQLGQEGHVCPQRRWQGAVVDAWVAVHQLLG